MDDTLYTKSHIPPKVLTVEALQKILEKVPKDTRVVLYSTSRGPYYIKYIMYDKMNERISIE